MKEYTYNLKVLGILLYVSELGKVKQQRYMSELSCLSVT